jgi:probable 2-oxoglutarate dehydrogenase E1 component DHKTD1
MPAIETIFTQASKHGIKSIILGMPHRGRLNLLVSLLDFPARALFAKVKGKSLIPPEYEGHCDVASHIAKSVTKKFDKVNDLSVSLLHNPSHLEAINPVAMGKTRCKADELNDANGDKTMCFQIHGDAAFIGQGVNHESLMMSYLPNFTVNGTVHMIINNQLGFTTGAARYRSSRYSSDLGKIINAPVLHVNADYPEQVIRVCRIAMNYRKLFKKDIIIDLVGYRKHGHNEVDEPSFTQPNMYNNIRSRKSVVTLYAEQLQSQGLLSNDHIEKIKAKVQQHLETELNASNNYIPPANEHFQGKWQNITQAKHNYDTIDTGYDSSKLKQIATDSVKLPQDFNVHNRLKRGHIEPRLKVAESGSGIDWATGESMAFGSLMQQGYNVRISGQDVDRGTFSHRHTVFVDQTNETRYSPLQQANYNGKIYSVNSHLSEFAVLGFEFGYSWESPKTLNIWEAQFGDFNNGAQIIIDQFIGSTESKWLRCSGLVVLLPHGYDGAGPEHSSARIERFLQLTDNKFKFPNNNESVNMLIANVTTPAQYFHILRRQLIRNYRKPLIIATPKTLLRHDKAINNITDFNTGTQFQSVLNDNNIDMNKVDTLAFISGKVYYELDAARTQNKCDNIAFIRIEELSPFPWQSIKSIIELYISKSKPGIKNVVWFQEEPQNAGCWSYIEPRINSIISTIKSSNKKFDKLISNINYIGRKPIASAGAVGSGIEHKKEVETIFKQIFETSK